MARGSTKREPDNDTTTLSAVQQAALVTSRTERQNAVVARHVADCLDLLRTSIRLLSDSLTRLRSPITVSPTPCFRQTPLANRLPLNHQTIRSPNCPKNLLRQHGRGAHQKFLLRPPNCQLKLPDKLNSVRSYILLCRSQISNCPCKNSQSTVIQRQWANDSTVDAKNRSGNTVYN